VLGNGTSAGRTDRAFPSNPALILTFSPKEKEQPLVVSPPANDPSANPVTGIIR
jgi:hypothetical protein